MTSDPRIASRGTEWNRRPVIIGSHPGNMIVRRLLLTVIPVMAIPSFQLGGVASSFERMPASSAANFPLLTDFGLPLAADSGHTPTPRAPYRQLHVVVEE